jgi:4-diphosphocytidyl-2C-methyl-D-erythritol kinase
MLDSPSASKFPTSAHNFDAVFSTPGLPASASKRKLDLLNLQPVETARVEAEEDKRRRNTAASARFRVKKKQREQQLEKTAKDMTDKANKLEKRVHELELENKWLKGLITEKTGTGAAEFTELFDKFLTENESSASAVSERIAKAVKAEKS